MEKTMAMEMEMLIALEVVKRTPLAIRTVQSNRGFFLGMRARP